MAKQFQDVERFELTAKGRAAIAADRVIASEVKRLYRVEFAGCPDDYVLATSETVAIDAVREILRKRMDDAAISFVGVRLLSSAPLYVETPTRMVQE